MAQRITDATLVGYEGPFFPQGVEELNEMELGNAPWSKEALRNETGFLGLTGSGIRDRPATTDDYEWYVGFRFQVTGGGTVAVLMPWKRRWLFPEGETTERSCAVYTRGRVSEKEKQHALRKMVTAFREQIARDEKRATA